MPGPVTFPQRWLLTLQVHGALPTLLRKRRERPGAQLSGEPRFLAALANAVHLKWAWLCAEVLRVISSSDPDS